MRLFPRSLAALALLTLANCPGPAANSPTASKATARSDVVRWARGRRHLAAEPLTGDGVALVVLPAGQTLAGAVRQRAECGHFTQVLPAPAPDTRLFYLDNRHVVWVGQTPSAKPEVMDGFDAALGVEELLGFANVASPLQLLVATRLPGADDQRYWKLTVGEQRALHRQDDVTGAPALASTEAFFAAYTAPRCEPGGHRCLYKDSDTKSWFLNVEDPQGIHTEQLEPPLGNTPITDVVWKVPDQSYYLLVPC